VCSKGEGEGELGGAGRMGSPQQVCLHVLGVGVWRAGLCRVSDQGVFNGRGSSSKYWQSIQAQATHQVHMIMRHPPTQHTGVHCYVTGASQALHSSGGCSSSCVCSGWCTSSAAQY
jgi:hypothetical protein